jgi:iron complex outermembrane recepter protein
MRYLLLTRNILLLPLAPLALAAQALPEVPAATAPTAAEIAAIVELEPVRVTADLWASPVTAIPTSVSVYEGAQLAREGVRHFGDLAQQIPNLTWTGGTARPRYFQIRGIGEASQYEGETPDSAVVFKVDDLDFTGLGGLGTAFDTQQIEVLRGPQAGAFGANAAGGVIRLVTNEPTATWSVRAESTVGTDNLREAGLAFGGSLLAAAPEKLMFRVALQQSSSDSFRRNATLDRDTNARDEFFARLRLTWNPSAAWRWDVSGFYGDQDNGFDEFSLDNNGRFTFSDEPGEDRLLARAGALRGVYTGSTALRFTTITQVGRVDSTYSFDSDWGTGIAPSSFYSSFASLGRVRDTFSQEIRIDSAESAEALGWLDRWTLGVYGARLQEAGVFTTTGNPALTTNYQADNRALYAQGAHDFGAATRVILGVRVERVAQRSQVDADGNGVADFAPSFGDTLGGGKLTLEHDLTRQHRVFASVARGYKSGGVAVDPNLNPATDPLTFATEDLWSYELGWRGHWWEDRLVGELTAFYLDRYEAQLRGSVGANDVFRYFTINGDQANVHGLESALNYRFAADWSLRGTLALMNSSRERFTLPTTPSGVAAERELAATPTFGYSVAVRYAPVLGWFGGAELVGRDAYYESEGTNEERDPSVLVNGSLGYAWRDWQVTLWGRNLLDEAYEKRVFFFDNGAGPQRYVSRGDPRQIGVTFGYEF